VHGSILACDGAGVIVSAPGEGTEFSVYFPLVAVPDAPEPSPGEVQECRGSERILVVDDEPMIADTTAIGLTRLGYDVTAVNDPAEALRMFGTDPAHWHVVISDEAMPGMRGSALFQRMRALDPALRFILCTGYSDGLTEEQRRIAGMDAYFHKPVAPSQLADKIRQLVAG
jgi:CheY-like chemotaxis protein